MQPGADILAVFTRLSKAATEIEKVAKFAHDDHLGYITSCPTNLGTALRASVHIKLPKFILQKLSLGILLYFNALHFQNLQCSETYDSTE